MKRLQELSRLLNKISNKKGVSQKDLSSLRIIQRRLGEIIPEMVELLKQDQSKEALQAKKKEAENSNSTKVFKPIVPPAIKNRNILKQTGKIKQVKFQKMSDQYPENIQAGNPVNQIKKDINNGQISLEFSGKPAQEAVQAEVLKKIAASFDLPLAQIKKIHSLAVSISFAMSLEDTLLYLMAELSMEKFKMDTDQLKSIVQTLSKELGLKIK